MKEFSTGVCRKSNTDYWNWYITHEIDGEQMYYVFQATPDGFMEFMEMLYTETHDYSEHIDAVVFTYVDAVTKNR